MFGVYITGCDTCSGAVKPCLVFTTRLPISIQNLCTELVSSPSVHRRCVLVAVVVVVGMTGRGGRLGIWRCALAV